MARMLDIAIFGCRKMGDRSELAATSREEK